jgi:hypothetical protein
VQAVELGLTLKLPEQMSQEPDTGTVMARVETNMATVVDIANIADIELAVDIEIGTGTELATGIGAVDCTEVGPGIVAVGHIVMEPAVGSYEERLRALHQDLSLHPL